jgi:hypothetical protein
MTTATDLFHGRVKRPRHSSTGNAVLLVMVDSSGPYHHRSIVDETILVALEHFGFPYRLLDLAYQRPTAHALQNCAALLIAQDGLGDRLSPGETQLIADAVHHGTGLINFDWDLRHYHGPLLEIFGFRGVERLPIASNLLLIPSNEHYITWLQQPRAFHASQRMVTALVVQEWRDDVVPLAEAVLGKEQLIYIRHLVPGNAFEPRHYPFLFATQWGQGRAVQYTMNPRLWRASALGHLNGMDDVFWRAIVWAARKPFVANMIPPFVTMSFDDCSGRHDFRYLDICSQHNYTPLVSVYLDHIREKHRPTLQHKVKAREIVVDTHGWNYYKLLYYDFGIDEHPDETLKEFFVQEDEFYRWLGVQPCRTVRSHWGEHGVRSLPYLKERGRTLICVPIHIGEHKADQYRTDAGEGYWPYDTVKCFYDYLPDDNDFYIFGAFNVRELADFLTGTTISLQESPFNDIEKASDYGAGQIRRGLDNGFYGEVLTHEQKLAVLTLEEWDHILTRIADKTDRYEKIFATHDEIAQYLKSKDQTWLTRIERLDGHLHGDLSGHTKQTLRLSMFLDQAGDIERRFLEVPVFRDQTELDAKGI